MAIVNEILLHSDAVAEIRRDQLRGHKLSASEEKMIEDFGKLRYSRWKDDPIEPRLTASVGNLESKCEALRRETIIQQFKDWVRGGSY